MEQRPNDEGGASSADDDGEFCSDLTLDWLQVTVFTIFGARKWLSKAKESSDTTCGKALLEKTIWRTMRVFFDWIFLGFPGADKLNLNSGKNSRRRKMEVRVNLNVLITEGQS